MNLFDQIKEKINKKINLILLNKIGKTTKPKKIALNSKEINKFLNHSFN